MVETTVYGFRRSVYVRIVRLALEEKAVSYRLVEIDPFAPGGPPADYLERHPFGRIPAFERDGFRLYETSAIVRYVDEACPGPALQPVDPRRRARMNQVLGLVDRYGYRAMVWDVFVERSRAAAADEARIAAGLAQAETLLRTLGEFLGKNVWLTGPDLTLADLHLAPVLAYFRRVPDGAALLERHGSLLDWWARIGARPSMQATRFPAEEAA